MQLAKKVIEVTGSSSKIEQIPYEKAYPVGFEDMQRRVPDISKIAKRVGWKPNSNWNIFNRAGADITSDRFYQKTPKYFFQPFDAFYGAGTASSQNQSLAGGYFEQTINTTTFYNDLIATYSKQLTEDVSFEGMLGANATATTGNSLAANIDPDGQHRPSRPSA